MRETQIDQFVKDRENMRLFQQERVILEVTERMCELMESKKMTRKDLADLLGKSKSHVTQLLDGQHNMTLRTVSDVFLALGCSIQISTGSVEATVKPPTIALDVEDVNWTWPGRVERSRFPIQEIEISNAA